MWPFLGLLMVSVVSGCDPSTTVYGFLNESVLLPCNCSFVNSELHFHWQKEEKNAQAIIYYKGHPNITDKYMNRLTLFQEEKTNCSIQLDDLTVDDKGQYRCSDMSSGYDCSFVHLVTLERFIQHPPVTGPGGQKLFKCDVFTHDPDFEIQWYLSGELLSNSPNTTISTISTSNAFPGIHLFNSTLTTTASWTPQPRCVPPVAPPKRGSIIHPAPPSTPSPPPHRRRMWFIVPIGLAVALCLSFYHRRKIARQEMQYRRAAPLESISADSGRSFAAR
ncbi:uncharacterized protein LOC115403295 [Salarias fasciatus]|uniref:uncharacterized protein LOC115403295 n=1 Tax=Salarias fasciatus TaxID=181472 RepID=UPI0011768566|nr:uncharacterized protein LOC115403295 [Salarias fasciatus]